MDSNIIRQIQRISDSNVQNIASIRKLYTDALSMITKNKWYKYDVSLILGNSCVLDKKMRDSAISLNKIYRSLIYDNYESAAIHFSKKAQCVSNTVPAVIDTGNTISFSAQFTNLGVFYSWTSDKGVCSELKIKRSDSSLYHSSKYPLDTTIPQNVPGKESSNEDYGKVKIFNFSYDADMPAGAYVFSLSITDTALDDYNTVLNIPVTVR